MKRRIATYALAFVATALALLVRGAPSRWLGPELPYITFFGAVMAASCCSSSPAC